MKRYLLVSSLAMLLSVGLADPIQAQSPSNANPSQNGVTSNGWNNYGMGPYDHYGWSRYGSGRNNSYTMYRGYPTIFYPDGIIGNYGVQVVPYPSPNIYDRPRYMLRYFQLP
jgi:hypothetical protein